jgi:hypothetical protein
VLPASEAWQRAAAAPQPRPTMGCSLQEVAYVTITRALVSTSAPRTLPRTLCMRIGVPIPMGMESIARRRRMGTPLSVAYVFTLPPVTPRSALTVANGRGTIWATEADREREADNLPKDVTGPILMVMVLGVSYTETLIGEEGLTGFGDTSFMGESGHGSSEIPLRDLLARCVAFALDLGTRAAASASSSAGTTGSPLLDQANGVPRRIRDLFHRRAAMGLNRLSIQLGTCASLTGKPSRGGPMAAPQFSASRLKTWRGACLTAANNFSLSCAEGRTYGPSRQLVMLQ